MKLSHVNTDGVASMVDVSGKRITVRTAEAFAEIKVSNEIYHAIEHNTVAKGDVLSIAKFAGIQAAKQTSSLIPLCHNIFISHVTVELSLNKKNSTVEITSTATTTAQTGIEMEALTAVSIAALTVYDMCKAINKEMIIGNICLIRKSGGASGTYERNHISAKKEENNNDAYKHNRSKRKHHG